jgi:hypothetical protein
VLRWWLACTRKWKGSPSIRGTRPFVWQELLEEVC